MRVDIYYGCQLYRRRECQVLLLCIVESGGGYSILYMRV